MNDLYKKIYIKRKDSPTAMDISDKFVTVLYWHWISDDDLLFICIQSNPKRIHPLSFKTGQKTYKIRARCSIQKISV